MNTFTDTRPEIDVRAATERLAELSAEHQPKPAEVFKDEYLSHKYKADIWIVSDAHQETGAYKERGALNKVARELETQTYDRIITASSGNHAAAVAKAARVFKLPATIFVPEVTPLAKIENIRNIGQDFVKIEIAGGTFDDAAELAAQEMEDDMQDSLFVHPFDDPLVASGQGTIMNDVSEVIDKNIDILAVPVGGGGLLSGIMHAGYKDVHYIGVEPLGAASLYNNLIRPDHCLEEIDTFVDGAAVKKVGGIVLEALSSAQQQGEEFTLVRPSTDAIRQATQYYWEDSGQTSQYRACRSPLKPELAGALSTASLQYLQKLIKGKTVACVVSGGKLSQERYDKEVKLPS